MVASFLDEKDYKDPAAYQPTASNTITVEFKVSERYPDFADKVAAVEQWWVDYVDTGISPEYDEKKDAEILAALRTNTLSPETAEVVHTKVPSNKDPNKEVTFANLGDKSPADGFDTEPVARALTLGSGNNAAPKAAPKTQTASAPAKTGLDIDALLG